MEEGQRHSRHDVRGSAGRGRGAGFNGGGGAAIVGRIRKEDGEVALWRQPGTGQEYPDIALRPSPPQSPVCLHASCSSRNTPSAWDAASADPFWPRRIVTAGSCPTGGTPPAARHSTSRPCRGVGSVRGAGQRGALRAASGVGSVRGAGQKGALRAASGVGSVRGAGQRGALRAASGVGSVRGAGQRGHPEQHQQGRATMLDPNRNTARQHARIVY